MRPSQLLPSHLQFSDTLRWKSNFSIIIFFRGGELKANKIMA